MWKCWPCSRLQRWGLHPEGLSEGELTYIEEERDHDKKDGMPQRSGYWQQRSIKATQGFHNIESSKDKILEAKQNFKMYTTISYHIEIMVVS